MQTTQQRTAPIIFLAAGTRGDIQPLLALAVQLAQHGRAVRFVAPARFANLIQARGIAYAELAGDLNELLDTPSGQDALLATRPLRSILATWSFITAAQERYAAMLKSAWQHCHDAGMLIATLPTAVAATQIARARQIPLHLMLLQPHGATSTFASPFWPLGHAGRYNLLTHRLIDLITWLPWQRVVADWCRSTLRIEPPNWPGPLWHEQHPQHTWYGLSEWIVPRPPDWPASRQICGFWFLDRPAEWQPPVQIQNFLEQGTTPVYVGFGSMGLRETMVLELIIHELRQRQLRGLIAGMPLPRTLAGPDLLAIEPTWHDWLFPQLAMAIHHGGAGTTAAVLRAGIPMWITPIGIDQLFWGRRIAQIGCGAPPVGFHHLSAPAIEQALDHALQPAIRRRAAALGLLVQRDQGLERTTKQLLAHLDTGLLHTHH
jgi:sterol 3beta-glucosyltransferase